MSEGSAAATLADLTRGQYVGLSGLPEDLPSDWRVTKHMRAGVKGQPIRDSLALQDATADHIWLVVSLVGKRKQGWQLDKVLVSRGSPGDERELDVDLEVESVSDSFGGLS